MMFQVLPEKKEEEETTFASALAFVVLSLQEVKSTRPEFPERPG